MTEIQWTDLTRNPIKEASGGNYCIPISSGCKNCYASALNSKGTRFGGNGRRFGIRPEGHPEMSLNTEMLLDWTRMRKSKKIFVGSMTDIFGEWVPDWMIFALFLAMSQSPFQTFQILTKRPERAAEVISTWLYLFGSGQLPANIWLGTSAEDQATYDDRIKWLNRCLAQVRFLSLEPLLGPIDLGGDIKDVDWVIVGGESGPHARPLNLAWIYDILAQCNRAEISVFIKQLGSYWAKSVGAHHSKGGDPAEWFVELRQRNFPDYIGGK
jgi:protein gp37